MPFAVPPPQPPPNFTGMSDQELRELEGTERNNVEARIRCLRNIQVVISLFYKNLSSKYLKVRLKRKKFIMRKKLIFFLILLPRVSTDCTVLYS